LVDYRALLLDKGAAINGWFCAFVGFVDFVANAFDPVGFFRFIANSPPIA
jgi:hypothetical protein